MSEEQPLPLRRLRRGPCFVLAAEPFAEVALELGLLERGGLEALLREARPGSGRAGTATLALPGRPERLHLRPLHHGGWLGGLWGDRWLGLARPLGELRANARLFASGAPVPRPAFAAARRRWGPVWRAAVATVHEEGCLHALDFLRAAPGSERLGPAAAAAGAALRELHERGGRHADLQLRNVLLREEQGRMRALLVDLDRARVGPPPGPHRRMAEIMRLYRSGVKHGLESALDSEACEAFLESYTAGDGRLRAALLERLPRERRRLARHRLLYR